LAEHISIDHYVAALGDPIMRMFVMSRDPVMLKDALNFFIRYEALLLGATDETQLAVLNPAMYVYDDKGRKKESIRAVEIHQDTKQRELERSLEAQKCIFLTIRICIERETRSRTRHQHLRIHTWRHQQYARVVKLLQLWRGGTHQ